MFVQTVRGPVHPDEVGFTLPAEHFYIKLCISRAAKPVATGGRRCSSP